GLVGVVGFAERRRGGRRAGGRVRLRGDHRHVGRCNVEEGLPLAQCEPRSFEKVQDGADNCGLGFFAPQTYVECNYMQCSAEPMSIGMFGDMCGYAMPQMPMEIPVVPVPQDRASGPHAAAVRAGLHACVADGPHGAAAAGPRVRQERPEQAQLQVDAPRRRDPWRGVHVVVHHVVPTRPCGPPASEGGPVCAGECLRAGTLAPGASSPLLGGARVHAIARRPNHHASAKQGPLSLPLQSASAAAQPGCAELHVGVCQLCPAAGVAAAWPSRSASDSPTAPLLPAALQLCST
ncbi:unnamed protein product, partial [Prorocentrum cordatum]